MKTNFATLALLIASTTAVAVPEVEPVFQYLQVKSDFFPGVIFSGAAESIYNEMKTLNPNSVGNITAEEDVSLVKSGGSSYNCNWGTPIPSWTNCINGVGYLQDLGWARCAVGPGYGNHARVSCDHSCGFHLYNKLASDLWVNWGDIATDVNTIARNCQHGTGNGYYFVRGAKDFYSHFIGVGDIMC